MIIEQISITKNNTYDANPTGYKGHIRIKGAFGAIELALNNELSAQILKVIGDNAVESARGIAQQLSADVFSAPAIESRVTNVLTA